MLAPAAPVRLRWDDAARMIAGQRVTIFSRTIKGRVQPADSAAIALDNGRGVQRSNVADSRMTRYTGNGRYMANWPAV